MLLIIIGIIVLGLVFSNVRIVSQSDAYVIERLGSYKETWGTGVHVKVPIVDVVAKRVSLKEKVMDFAPQSVITKDNVTVQIDSIIYYQIMDPKLYTYGAENPLFAIENLTATTLRNLIGELELDEALTSRDTINAKLRSLLDEASDAWGIKVNRVELKDITPPSTIITAMERQMKAERERRETILNAEGEKRSKELIAEGDKRSMVLRAEGEYEATILEAKAKKEAEVLEAEAQATAIRLVQEAEADGIRMINEADASRAYIQLKSLEALGKVADGKATKLIIPSDMQSLAGIVASVKEIASTTEEK